MKFSQYLIFLIFNFFITTTYAESPIVCTQEYALCTSAKCIPDPRRPDFTICFCDVEQGESVGFISCDKRIPKLNKFNVKQLISTFSFKQFKIKKSMTCPQGTPWSDCVDAPCIMNPSDPSKAICSCKINHDQIFFTFGGNCELKQCKNGFWSGATTSNDSLLRDALSQKMKRTSDIQSSVSCPIKEGNAYANH